MTGPGSESTTPCGPKCERPSARSRRQRPQSSTASRFARPKAAKNAAYDAGKKITGRKRHIAVDTLGLLLAIVVHPADWQDQHGAWWVMEKLDAKFRRLKVIFGRFRLRPKFSSRLGGGHLRLGATNRASAGRYQRLRCPAETMDRRTYICLACSASSA